MIISIDVENHLTKSNTLSRFKKKKLKKPGIERNFFNLIKGISKKTVADKPNHRLEGKSLQRTYLVKNY